MDQNNDDIPLKEFKSPIQSDDEEQISTVYNSIDKASKNDSDDSETEAPLLEKTLTVEDKQPKINREQYGASTSAEVEGLMQETNLDHIETEQEENIDETEDETEHINIIKNRIKNLSKDQIKKLAYSSLLPIGLLLIIFASSNMIYTLEYNQLGLSQSSLSGKIDPHAYGPGIHFFLPWKKWIIFDKTAHSIDLKDLSIFTKDKLSVKVTFKMYYFLNPNSLVEFYRKFGNDYKRLLILVCKSELLNNGLKFSIDDYRTNRAKIRSFLKESLARKFETDYQVKFFDLYFDKISFTKEINRLNLLRMLNGIYNEKASFEKKTNLTIVETKYQINLLKNKAKEILESARLKANNTIIKKQEINLKTKLEFIHVESLTKSVYDLNILGKTKSKNETQQTLSFCYLSSLINNDKIRIVQPDKSNLISNGHSTKFDSIIGLVSL